jgi:hypothetical protein
VRKDYENANKIYNMIPYGVATISSALQARRDELKGMPLL